MVDWGGWLSFLFWVAVFLLAVFVIHAIAAANAFVLRWLGRKWRRS